MGTCFTTPAQTDAPTTEASFLETTAFDDLPMTSYEGRRLLAKVVQVYDGDTITIGFDDVGASTAEPREHRPVKYRMRLSGYDAPERQPRVSSPLHDLEKEAARVARDVLADRILGKIVTVDLVKNEKFGRLCGIVSLNGVCINDTLGHQIGKPFDGKTKKKPWTEAELRAILMLAHKL